MGSRGLSPSGLEASHLIFGLGLSLLKRMLPQLSPASALWLEECRIQHPGSKYGLQVLIPGQYQPS